MAKYNIEHLRDCAERFWSKVERGEGCWEWRGRRHYYGYGFFDISNDFSPEVAHRIAFALSRDRVPTLFVLHTCDNGSCCRPDHLYEGTQKQNVADMHSRGRWRQRGGKGENNWRAALSNAQAQEIRALYAAGGITQHALAEQFSTTRAVVCNVVRGKSYKDGSRTASYAG